MTLNADHCRDIEIRLRNVSVILQALGSLIQNCGMAITSPRPLTASMPPSGSGYCFAFKPRRLNWCGRRSRTLDSAARSLVGNRVPTYSHKRKNLTQKCYTSFSVNKYIISIGYRKSRISQTVKSARNGLAEFPLPRCQGQE